MKKISLFAFSLISAFAITACDNATDEERDMDPYENEPGVTDPDRYDRDDRRDFDIPDEDDFNIPDEDDFNLPDEDDFNLPNDPDTNGNDTLRDGSEGIANEEDDDEDNKPENTVE